GPGREGRRDGARKPAMRSAPRSWVGAGLALFACAAFAGPARAQGQADARRQRVASEDYVALTRVLLERGARTEEQIERARASAAGGAVVAPITPEEARTSGALRVYLTRYQEILAAAPDAKMVARSLADLLNREARTTEQRRAVAREVRI